MHVTNQATACMLLGSSLHVCYWAGHCMNVVRPLHVRYWAVHCMYVTGQATACMLVGRPLHASYWAVSVPHQRNYFILHSSIYISIHAVETTAHLATVITYKHKLHTEMVPVLSRHRCL